MDKSKEIVALKKLYLIQVEKWESRTFFAMASLATSITLFLLQGKISYWWGITSLIAVIILYFLLEKMYEKWRTRKFNDLKKEIEKGEFKDMELRPEANSEIDTKRERLFRKTIWWLALVFLIISLCIIIWILATFLLSIITFIGNIIPTETHGVNNQKYDFPVKVYIINNETIMNRINASLQEANHIWNRYNITIVEKGIIFSNISLNISDKNLLFQSDNSTLINPIINSIIKNATQNYTYIILLNGTNSISEGKGCVGDSCVIILDSRPSVLGWNMAHEIGHTLSVKVECWKRNLMIESSSECPTTTVQKLNYGLIKLTKPAFLSQSQVDNAINGVKKYTR